MITVFYIALGVFVLSFLAIASILAVKVYETQKGKLLFSRKFLEKSDAKITRGFKKSNGFIKGLAIMSTKRKFFKGLRIGKSKKLINRLRKLFSKY